MLVGCLNWVGGAGKRPDDAFGWGCLFCLFCGYYCLLLLFLRSLSIASEDDYPWEIAVGIGCAMLFIALVLRCFAPLPLPGDVAAE
eukprot:m.10385 g.10385  ORF g.10385 m.10385 type:complete len:86 (+) comp6584_c0_seq2:1035-1292(+)